MAVKAELTWDLWACSCLDALECIPMYGNYHGEVP